MNKNEHARIMAKIKDRIAEEVDKTLDERMMEKANQLERMTDKVYAAGMTKAITIINEVEAEAEVGK